MLNLELRNTLKKRIRSFNGQVGFIKEAISIEEEIN